MHVQTHAEINITDKAIFSTTMQSWFVLEQVDEGVDDKQCEMQLYNLSSNINRDDFLNFIYIH